MEKLLDNNFFNNPRKSLFVSKYKILFCTLMTFILINNFVYQSAFQVEQKFFISLYCMIILLSFLSKQKVPKKIILGLVPLWIIFIINISFNLNESFYINRSIIAVIVCISFLTTFFLFRYHFFQYNQLYNYYFYIVVLIVLVGALATLLTSSRAVVPNPNWWAMTLFYALSMSKYRNKIVCYMAVLGISMIYESRGTALSAVVAIFLFLPNPFPIKKRMLLFSCFFIVSVFSFLGFISFYTNNQQMIDTLISSFSERGFSGREEALIPAWKILKYTNYFGQGIGSESGFALNARDSVQIHFGFLDLSLRFSLYVASLLIVIISSLIKESNPSFFPGLAGAVMSIFYYNGFGISHYGLNLLLIMLLAMSGKLSHSKKN